MLQPAMRPIAKEFHSPIISRIKVMAELDIAEKRVPQDGRFRHAHAAARRSTSACRSCRASTARTRSSVSSTRSRSASSSRSCSSTSSASRAGAAAVPEATSASRTGWCSSRARPASGKTTTLYAALSEIKSIEDKIVTIEDPVEYQLRGITQIPINEKKGLTFARGLRSILRHDPDKIMVGEIRDPETAQIAIQSALTGPPGLHDRPREQRRRRARPLPEHGRRAVSVRLGARTACWRSGSCA